MHRYVASFTLFVATLNGNNGLKERFSATNHAVSLKKHWHNVASAGVPATLHRNEWRSQRCQGCLKSQRLRRPLTYGDRG
jgi:hypothetical protein